MDIKKADSKGRITVGAQGEHYWTETREDGTIVLHPLNIPEFPQVDNDALRAVYWDVAAGIHRPDRILINSVIGGSLYGNSDWVAKIANDLKVPVVIRAVGVGAGAADLLVPQVEKGVIKTYLPKHGEAAWIPETR